jgi:hypothetical protein
MAVDIPADSHPPGHAYSNYRCEDWDCCKQWWCETWYFRVEMLALARDHDPQSRVLIQSGSGSPVFSANDFGFPLAPGVSTLLGHRLDGQSAIELAYFGANQWNIERTVSGPADLSLSGSLGSSLNDFNLADVMELSLRSTWHNAEVNYLYDPAEVSFLAGFRYLGWHEQLAITSTDSDLDRSDYRVNVSNNLLGGQVGARVARYYYGLDLEMTGKVGIFRNEATQAQIVTDLNGTSLVRNVSATDGGIAFVGDLNISATCPVYRRWRLRAGYNLVGISGLAVAVNQLSFSDSAAAGRQVRQDSGALLHGFNLGLEAVW